MSCKSELHATAPDLDAERCAEADPSGKGPVEEQTARGGRECEGEQGKYEQPEVAADLEDGEELEESEGTEAGDFPEDRRPGKVFTLERHDEGARVVHGDRVPVHALFRGVRVEGQAGKLLNVHPVACQRVLRRVAFAVQIREKAAQRPVRMFCAVFPHRLIPAPSLRP